MLSSIIQYKYLSSWIVVHVSGSLQLAKYSLIFPNIVIVKKQWRSKEHSIQDFPNLQITDCCLLEQLFKLFRAKNYGF